MKTCKKLIAAVLAIVLVFIVMPTTAVHANEPITIIVDGEEVMFTVQKPIIVDNHVLVPVREMFEHMGFNTYWDPDERVATLTNGYSIIVIPLDESSFIVDGEIFTPEIPQQIINNRLMLPVAAIAEAIGTSADFDGVNRVAIITPAPVPPPADSGAGALAGTFVYEDREYNIRLIFTDDTITIKVPHSEMYWLPGGVGWPGDFIVYGNFSINHTANIINAYIDEASIYRAVTNKVDVWAAFFEYTHGELPSFADGTGNLSELVDIFYVDLIDGVSSLPELIDLLFEELLDELAGWRLTFHDSFDRLYDYDYGDVFVRIDE